MKTEKLFAGVFAAVLGGMAVKTFKTIIDERKRVNGETGIERKQKDVEEDEL